MASGCAAELTMSTEDAAVEFSPVRGDALFRRQRAVGPIPVEGPGVVRRAALAVLVTRVPRVVAAAERRDGLRWMLIAGLVGDHHRRWIAGEPRAADAMLAAPELGAGADPPRLYEAVRALRPVPVPPRIVAAIVGPILLPAVPHVAIEVHLGPALFSVVRTLR
jgi:hypothetical protein